MSTKKTETTTKKSGENGVAAKKTPIEKKKPVVAAKEHDDEPAPVQPEFKPSEVEGEIKTPLFNVLDFRSISFQDVAVVFDEKWKKLKVVRLQRDKATGEYVDPEKSKYLAGLTVQTPSLLLANTSTLSGEGDVGKEGQYGVVTRSNCHYNLGLLGADLTDHVFYPELAEEQAAFFKWGYEMSRYIAGLIFDAGRADWSKLLNKAKEAARNTLYREYDCAKPALLARKEESNPEIAEKVRELARTNFINAGKFDFKDPDVVEGTLSIWAKYKVWEFQKNKYDPAKHSKELCPKGPSLLPRKEGGLPSVVENWGDISEVMTGDEMVRVYQQINFINISTLKKIDAPEIAIQDTTKKPDGTKVTTIKKVPNPFFNPCLVDINGERQESLVSAPLFFVIKHKNDDSEFSIRIKFKPDIQIVEQQKRREQEVTAPTLPQNVHARGYVAPVAKAKQEQIVVETHEQPVTIVATAAVDSTETKKRESVENGGEDEEHKIKRSKKQDDEEEEGEEVQPTQPYADEEANEDEKQEEEVEEKKDDEEEEQQQMDEDEE